MHDHVVRLAAECLAQVEQRNPGVFNVSYLERGPEAWRLLFARG
jgi:uncharacterized protein (DUF2249 family)